MSEWQIMEVLWVCGEPLMSSKVCKRMQGDGDMPMRTVWTLLQRLALTEEQIEELEEILEKSREQIAGTG